MIPKQTPVPFQATTKAVSLILGIALGCTTLQAQSSNITVRADAPGRKASPDLYGIFVEDWCHQIEGGIYAEMIRNRNFDDTNSAKEVLVAGFAMRLPEQEKASAGKKVEVPGWKLAGSNPGNISWSIDQERPLNDRNPRHLRLEVKEVDGRVGIFNEGHCTNVKGIAVTKGSQYLFSCYARSETPNAGLNIVIETPDNRVLASKEIKAITGDWKKYDLTLTASESLTGARLFVAPTGAGVYHLDMISLFPKETWKGRPNGLRKDLMEFVAAMKPSFVRFPGGCFVEGLGLENAWHWKNTLGDVAQRPGHWNIWGWRYSGGMGYHEFLQMCEDLGAEPLHVVNDGISHMAVNGVQVDGVYAYQPMDQMHVLVQDALDSIEYANGPVTSKWGAMRAAAGHPEPFNLKYVEIGNENHGPEYAERYALFHDAIKAKYPEITVIMDTWGANNYPRNRVADMIDIHRFTTPYQHALNYFQFDKYERKKPKVYFGEWCVELELPNKESLEVGLYEGAFLTGLEKNSDHVLMMSYAPFMNNLGWQNRKPNMIGFDLDRVYGAPIYWIQRMYSENQVETLLDFAATSPEYRPEKVGTIGVGSQGTAVEFKDIVVSNASGVLFDGNTAKPGAWIGEGKRGKSQQPRMIALGEEGSHMILTGQEFKGDYTITLKARKLSGKNGFNVFFNTYFNTRYIWQIGGDGNKSAKFIGDGFANQKIASQSIETDRWYDLKLEIRGDDIKGYIDGGLVNETSYRPLQALYVSAGRKDSAGEIVLKVINVSPSAQQTRVQVPGAVLDKTGEAIVLTSADPLAKNSMETPNHVVPKTSVIGNVSADFEHTFPAYSATVLRLKEKK